MKSLFHFSRLSVFSKTALFFILLLCFLEGKAQEYNTLGSWNILNVKYNLNENWSLFGEAQLRSLDFYNDFHYYEMKGGFNYKPSSNVMLSFAGGKYDTYNDGGNFVSPKNNSEIRLWPMVTLTQSIWKLKIEQRYRMEMRFTSNGYRNRFRYRLGVALPYGKNAKGEKPFQIGISNEIFFTDKQPYFERNRFIISNQYKLTPESTIQIGYLHQFDYRITDETGTDFLVLGYFFEFDRKQNKQQ